MENLMGTANRASRSAPFRLPTGAWAEVRDASGERLATLRARLERGSIVVDIPAFAHGMRGTIALLVEGGLVERTLTAGVDDLPTEQMQWVIEYQASRGIGLPQPAMAAAV
jgi:hypothetical protein